MTFNKWDLRFLELAQHIASFSKDPSTKVGAVIADQKQRIVSIGYNGFARGVKDRTERLEDRDLKYKMVVHAEVNAILFAGRPLEGMTIYTYPFLSCSSCSSIIINAGIKRLVTVDYFPERWKENFDLSQELYREASVNVFFIPIDHLSTYHPVPLKEPHGN